MKPLTAQILALLSSKPNLSTLDISLELPETDKAKIEGCMGLLRANKQIYTSGEKKGKTRYHACYSVGAYGEFTTSPERTKTLQIAKVMRSDRSPYVPARIKQNWFAPLLDSYKPTTVKTAASTDTQLARQQRKTDKENKAITAERIKNSPWQIEGRVLLTT